jgi:hypothetical protein
MQDDLFRPTITARPAPGRPPWRPQSIVYPAFFAGPLAAVVLGVLNGRRLALPRWQVLAIAAAGLVGLGARLAVSAMVDDSGLRVAGVVAGLLVWLVVLWFQRRPFRAAQFGGVRPASLIGPGLAAFFGCGFLEAALVYWLVR